MSYFCELRYNIDQILIKKSKNIGFICTVFIIDWEIKFNILQSIKEFWNDETKNY
jgi:hypothetical protein